MRGGKGKRSGTEIAMWIVMAFFAYAGVVCCVDGLAHPKLTQTQILYRLPHTIFWRGE